MSRDETLGARPSAVFLFRDDPMADLLYEIGTEEIPAGYIRPALDQLHAALERELNAVLLEHGAVRTAGTPRRLVVAAPAVTERQPDTDENILGPPAKIAFDDDGNPTRAALGFARSQGMDVGDIGLQETLRGAYCVVKKRTQGRPARDILAEVLPKITLELSFPKSMLWPSGERPFARPVRRLLALLGREVIPFSLFGLQPGRSTERHPMLCPGQVDVPDANFEAYASLLRQHKIVVDIEERKAVIRERVEADLKPFGNSLEHEALLDEVTNLVQYPSVTVGTFDKAFLDVPAAVVEAAMTEHQRYFPVRDAQGKLCPKFIVVSDRGPDHSDLVRCGNEEVLRARLADARFFDQQDSRMRLEDRVPQLDGVQFLTGLGTYKEKSHRLEKLVGPVSAALGLDAEAAAHAARAALLCKADLITEMVGEFPKLQGEVGRIYALREGEPSPVAEAIVEHYMPLSADGRLPRTEAGLVLSLAEKLDNMTGCFALQLIPSGSADPYGLRRQAHAALRMTEESGRHLSLASLLSSALQLLPDPHCHAQAAVPKLLDFLRDRLFQMALNRSAPHDLINAVLAAGFDDVVDFWMRLDALRRLAAEADWPLLVEAVERTFNISKNIPHPLGEVDTGLFEEPLEKDLWSLFTAHRKEIKHLEAERRYVEASQRYAEIFAKPLHEFFDKVFVNVDDEKVRNNRLTLLRKINRLYSDRVADLSQIVTGIHTTSDQPKAE